MTRPGHLACPVPEPGSGDAPQRDVLALRGLAGTRQGVHELQPGRYLAGRPDAFEGVHPDLDLGAAWTGEGACGASRRHAEIERTRGGWEVMDLGSTNGTWLNGQRLAPGDRRTLATGDRIAFGNLSFQVERAGGVPTGGVPTGDRDPRSRTGDANGNRSAGEGKHGR